MWYSSTNESYTTDRPLVRSTAPTNYFPANPKLLLLEAPGDWISSVAKVETCERYAGVGGLIADLELQVANVTSRNTISHLTEGSGIVSYARFTESNGITPYSQGSSSSRTILYDIWHCYAAAAALSLLKSTCRDGSTSANWMEQPFTMVPTPFTMKNGDLLPSW